VIALAAEVDVVREQAPATREAARTDAARLALAAAKGALAGAGATVVMSGVMAAFHRVGLLGEPPPRKIVRRGLAGLGLGRSEPGLELATALAHLAYGAGVGALYGAAAALRPGLAGPATGVATGLAVWAASYEGWLPAVGLHPSPGRDRPGRPAAMIAAHVAFGAALGAGVRRFGQ
jgi:hypothetical protein